MVATRRGTQASSPGKSSPDRSSEVQATPSTARRTTRAVSQSQVLSPRVLLETCCHVEEALSESPSTRRRCTRASRLHSPDQPSTPMGSTHDGDVSDQESCSSVMSAKEALLTRSRRRRKPLQPENQKNEDVSEVESCSSVISASKSVQSVRRSTRRRAVPSVSDASNVESADNKKAPVQNMKSESTRVTRSQRKPAPSRSITEQPSEESQLSDNDSCASSFSGADVSKSGSYQTTRSRRRVCPIPIELDEKTEGSPPPSSRRPTRAVRRKTAVLLETPSCDSDGFESGPTYRELRQGSLRTRARASKAVDSDSEVMEVHSPISERSSGTPCSSRTGSGSSRRNAPTSTRPVDDSSALSVEPAMEESSLNESRLETTVIADCTLQEEDESQLSEKQEGAETTDVISEDAHAVKEDSATIEILSHESPLESVVCTEVPAVTSQNQQEEPPTEIKASDEEMMQENVESSEPAKLCQPVTATKCEEDPGVIEDSEKQQVDFHLSMEEEEEKEEEAVDSGPSEEEKMEVSESGTDVQQEEEFESVQATSSQQEVRTDSEKTKIILLDSTDDEDDAEDNDVGDDEDEDEVELEVPEENLRREPSDRSVAVSSVDGLFMIDTRPGQEADEQYYKELNDDETTAKDVEQQKEEKEGEEEFVDEEGDDDEEDEDANVLFSGRIPHLKDLSSRIDPGVSVKQLGGLYISFDGSKSKAASLQKQKEEKIQEQLMKKSVIGADFEKKDAVPPYSESNKVLKMKRKAEKEKSTGDAWFNMKAPEITQELKGDLQVLKMRGSLDPKRFYKKNDRDGFPKYFQVGTVVDNPVDFYHSRMPKKQRKRTMVEELLADADFRQKNKKKYQSIIAEKAAQAAGKRFTKKKNKFAKK